MHFGVLRCFGSFWRIIHLFYWYARKHKNQVIFLSVNPKIMIYWALFV